MIAHKYKPGDRVVRYDRGGVVRKVMKYTARVRYDDANEDETENLAALQPETAKDVARREYERAVNEWMLRKPKTSAVTAQMAHRFGGPPKIDNVLTCARTPTEMRQAAEELRLIAEWFERRPSDP